MVRKRKAQTYVEFLVVLPLLLLLIFLLWEFAYYFWAKEVITTATFEAARTVAGGGGVAEGYSVYRDIVRDGLGRLGQEMSGGFYLASNPALRSVSARTEVRYPWPSGLAAFMGGGLNLKVKASSFFRLERFWPGPPEAME
jgi:hypothetical protein